MAVKIFCNACQNFIRDARRDELSDLKGTEICVPCETRVKGLYDEVEKVARRSIVKIQTASDKGKADMEEAMRRVIKEEE
jgi:hypothetical protein